ncbi:hypothetical protein WOLCODRAFT_159108 [Wolfiporia cocos MD-104 SS10]|uniref:Fungal-type protein kinase domain-containing protein n=1 Tax=Wolfiporia cocos (strain MD-104) TaxID=742152 RepID=A0A2H3JBE7_WOLCO|nr:hypothetical protein WOLCODRAFT_159108 [Wolfiporia cocos MD-104 SS10]
MPEQEKIDAAYGRVGSSLDPNASGTRALISQPPHGHGAVWNAQVRLSGYSRSPSPENEGIAWAGGRARVFKIPSGFSEYYRDKIVWGYNPVDFIMNVWGFDPTSLSSGPHLLSDTPHTGLYALPSDKLLFYCKAHQENAYQYLRDLINVLRMQLFGGERDITSRQNFRGTTVNCVQTLKNVVSRSVLRRTEKTGDYKGAASLPQQVGKHLVVIEGCDGQEGEAPTKPYMVLASGKDSCTHSWTWSLAPIHVRKATSPWRWKDDELRINLDSPKTRYREDHPAETVQAGQKRRRDANTDTESLDKPNKKRVLATLERLAKEDGSCQREAPRHIHVVWPSSSSSPDGPDATCTKSFERYEKETLKLIEKQMASNTDVPVLEGGEMLGDLLFSASPHFPSTPIDIVDQSELVLSTVAALEQADLHRLGICHLMHFDTRDGQFNSYENAQLVLDEGQDVKDAQGNVVKNALVFDVQLVSELQVYVENTLIGRGTTVIPIRATGYAATLFGCGRLVAKMAWHPSDRKGDEADCIRTIRRTLAKKKPHMLKHIVALKCSMSRTMEEMSLPRALMGVKALQERVFRVYVMQQYEPLHALPGAQEFKTVIIDVLRAHHWVYELCRILHADISYNNVMFYFSPSRVVGVLCDWDQGAIKIESLLDTEESFFPGLADRPPFWDPTDMKSFLASLRDQEEEDSISAICNSTTRLKYETGTGPFMAIDLLEQKDHPIHLYRHDLESFF